MAYRKYKEFMSEQSRFSPDQLVAMSNVISTAYNHDMDTIFELIANSRDAIDPFDVVKEGAVKITIDAFHKTLTVKDNGISMSQAELRRAIRYFSGTKSGCEGYTGKKGLGLSDVFYSCDYAEITCSKNGRRYTARFRGASSWRRGVGPEPILEFSDSVPVSEKTMGTEIMISQIDEEACRFFDLTPDQIEFCFRQQSVIAHTGKLFDETKVKDIKWTYTHIDDGGKTLRKNRKIKYEYDFLPDHLSKGKVVNFKKDYLDKLGKDYKTDNDRRAFLRDKIIVHKGVWKHEGKPIKFILMFWAAARCMDEINITKKKLKSKAQFLEERQAERDSNGIEEKENAKEKKAAYDRYYRDNSPYTYCGRFGVASNVNGMYSFEMEFNKNAPGFMGQIRNHKTHIIMKADDLIVDPGRNGPVDWQKKFYSDAMTAMFKETFYGDAQNFSGKEVAATGESMFRRARSADSLPDNEDINAFFTKYPTSDEGLLGMFSSYCEYFSDFRILDVTHGERGIAAQVSLGGDDERSMMSFMMRLTSICQEQRAPKINRFFNKYEFVTCWDIKPTYEATLRKSNIDLYTIDEYIDEVDDKGFRQDYKLIRNSHITHVIVHADLKRIFVTDMKALTEHIAEETKVSGSKKAG